MAGELITAGITSILPLATILLIRQLDHSFIVSKESWTSHYDYIIVGAGSAGSVIAARLSENPHVRVLLLEAGGSESIINEIPVGAISIQTTPIDWKYWTEPQEASCFGFVDRRSRWPRGKVLGGSSAINFMIYVRGNRNDFDNWAYNLGATGWSFADLYPYFLKAEDNRDPYYAYNGYHSTGGPLTVETPPDPTPVARVWNDAGRQLGYRAGDLNGKFQTGFMNPQGTLRRGARCSTSKAYLRDARKRPNLTVVTFAHVTKILFNSAKKAVGVNFLRFNSHHTVYAKKEIIVSAGAVNSPQVLMLSGIGPAEHLAKHGIPCISDIPVGKNLMDHIYPSIHFYTEEKVTLVQHRVINPITLLTYLAAGRGPLTSLGAIEGIAFIHSKYSNTTDWPDLQLQFISGGPSSDMGGHIRKAMGFTEEFWDKVYKPLLQYDSFSFYPILMRPHSRGYIRLRSKNPLDPPIINPRYLTDERDVHTLVDGMKFCIKLGFTPAYQKFNAKIYETVYPGCEQYMPLYSDEYLACMLRTYTQTIYHPAGTCKMGSAHDPSTVVDPYLRVKGVHGLRVVDASVMPLISTGNTNAAIIAIAERASDLIKGAVRKPYRPP